MSQMSQSYDYVNLKIAISSVTNMVDNSFHRYGRQLSDELPDGDSYEGDGEIASFPLPGVLRDPSREAVHD